MIRGVRLGKAGLPDIVVLPYGGLEVKRPGKRLRPSQEEMQKRFMEAGLKYTVVTSLSEAQEALGCYTFFRGA